jgi:hypothetical protein
MIPVKIPMSSQALANLERQLSGLEVTSRLTDQLAGLQ